MQIDVWSDYACPWCALGTARLDVALRDFEHGDAVTVVHRAFELDPRAPASSAASSEEAVSRKYGMPPGTGAGRPRADHRARSRGRLHLRLRSGAAWAAPSTPTGSPKPVRGTAWEEPLVRQLFAARFSEGRQLSDHEVLRDIAALGRRPRDAAPRRCSPARPTPRRSAPTRRPPRELGVTGVPYFLIGGAWPVPGAQDVETLGIVLQRRLVTRQPLSRGSRRPSRRWCWGGGRRSGRRSRPPRPVGRDEADLVVRAGGPTRRRSRAWPSPSRRNSTMESSGVADQLDVGRASIMRRRPAAAMASAGLDGVAVGVECRCTARENHSGRPRARRVRW